MSFNVVLEFLKVYWRELLVGSLTVLSFILCLLRKRNVSSIYEKLYSWCIVAVQIVEQTNLKGKDKLNKALEIINVFLIKEFPKLNVNDYRNTCVGMIENILSTPQKKED